jgi:hypothetical protein
MLTLLLIWTIGILAMLTLFIAAVRGWIMNLFFALAMIIDAFKDIACQLWIEVSRIWKGEKAIELDDSENFYHE